MKGKPNEQLFPRQVVIQLPTVGAKENQQLNPGGPRTKQQTKKIRPQPNKINSFVSGPSLRLTGVQLKREAKY